jgi:hypothetical protein
MNDVPHGMQLVDDKAAGARRLVDDDTAPVAHFVRPEEKHPFRQKELILEVTRRLDGAIRLTGHQIQCVRRVHSTDDNPTFSYAGKFASRQYSVAFAEWLSEQYKADPEFFNSACQQAREMPRARPVKSLGSRSDCQ